jgi:abortive infection Abi-like protein
MGELKKSEVHWVANEYIGVSEGYLGDFSYRTHREFYPAYCDLDIDPEKFAGTTRDRFLHILGRADPPMQAAILRGVARKYPIGSAVFRTKAASSQLGRLIARCSDSAAVAATTPRITSALVKAALADAATLLASSGPTSAVDRIHTALHGYLRTACVASGSQASPDATMNDLFKSLKQQHPSLRDLGEHQDAILKVLRALTSILDALNPARNRGSLAHPNEALLDEAEAVRFINAARTTLQYLDSKLNQTA